MADPQMPEQGIDNSGYYVPSENANTRTTYQQFLQLKTAQESSTRSAEDFSVCKQFNSKENDSTLSSVTSEQSGKRNASSIQITHATDVHKRFRSEKGGMSDQVISTFNEEGCINLDSKLDIDAIHNRILLDNGRLTGSLEFPITEDFFSESQVPDHIDNKKSCRLEQNNAMTMNISQTENAAGNITNTEAFKVKNVCSVDDMLAIPGPSSSSENFSLSNSCPEKSQNMSSLKVLPPRETEQKQTMCSVCKVKDISEHLEVYYGRRMYRCCQCLFRTKYEFALLKHISTHPLLRFICNVCNRRYSDASSHVETCDVCGKNLECKYQLEDHYQHHEEEFQIICRICRIEIDEHCTESEGKKEYECCFTECEYWTCSKSEFKRHLYKHSHLKLFKCEMCGCRFKEDGTLKRHIRNIHQ